MSNFVGRPSFSNSQWVAIETMQFHIAQTKKFLRTPSFPIQGVPMNNLAPMKNVLGGGVQGNLSWMPGKCFFPVLGEWWLGLSKGEISTRRGKKGKTINLTQ